MTKFLTLFILTFVLSWQGAFAVTSLPTKTISVEPLIAEDGSPIKINTLIYNNQKEAITFTLEVKAGDLILGSPVTTISALGAKTVSVDWNQPKQKTEVLVSVISALNKQKKDILSLHEVIGSIIIGTEDVQTPSKFSFGQGKVGLIISNIGNFFESFRLKQANYFVNMRDTAKEKLGLKVTSDIVRQLTPNLSAPTVGPTVSIDETTVNNPLEVYKVNNFKEYGNVMLASALAFIFESALVFYFVLVFMVFFIVKTMFKMFI